MIKLLVCMNKSNYKKNIEELLLEYKKSQKERFVQIIVVHSTIECLEVAGNEASTSKIILILDADMERGTGIGLLDKLKIHRYTLLVSKTDRFAMQALEAKVDKYMVFPIHEEAFYHILDSAVQSLDCYSKQIYFLQTQAGVVNIALTSIVYVEYSNHIFRFHLMNDEVYTSKTLRKSMNSVLKKILEDGRFVRPHQAYVINMAKVVKLLENSFLMQGGARIPISKQRMQEIKERFHVFIGIGESMSKNVIEANAFAITNKQRLEFLEKLPVAIAIVRVDVNQDQIPYDFVFVYVNEALEKLEGITREQVLGMSCCDVFRNIEKKLLCDYFETAYHGIDKTIEYESKQINKRLQIRCYQPMHGYCGCVLKEI